MNKPIIVEIIIWCTVLTFIFTIGIFCYSKIFIEPNIYNIEFEDIDGITKGSPVRFMGINVGYVRKLKPKEKHINVQIVITKKDMKIPNGTVARVEFYGLGGSKSIELMPAEDNGQGGIVTASTLRLHDMAMKTEDLVEILEAVEKMVKGINKPSTQKMLEGISEIKSEKMNKINADLSDYKANITEKIENIRKKEEEVIKKIDNMSDITDKLNKFIKK